MKKTKQTNDQPQAKNKAKDKDKSKDAKKEQKENPNDKKVQPEEEEYDYFTPEEIALLDKFHEFSEKKFSDDEIYEVMRRDDVFIGEVYTNMATGHREALSESARQLLKTIREVKR